MAKADEELLKSVASRRISGAMRSRSREMAIAPSRPETEDLIQANRRLQLLSHVANGLIMGDGSPDNIRMALGAIAEEIGAQTFKYYRLRTEPDILYLEVSRGIPAEMNRKLRQIRMGEHPAGVVATTRQPLIVDADNPPSGETTVHLREMGLKAYVGLPLISHGHLFGTIAFGLSGLVQFSMPEIALFRLLADHIAAMLDRTRLLDTLRQSDQRLKSSETRYRSVVEGSFQGIIIQQDGRIVYANPAMAQLFGYARPEEMIGLHSLDDLVEPEDQPVLKARTSAVYHGEKVKPHPGWRAKRTDGRPMWASSTARISEWQGKPAVTSFYSDITEQRVFELALRRSEDAYRRALRAAQSSAFEWNIATDTVSCSAETAGLLALEPEAFPRTNAEFLELIANEDRERARTEIAERLAGPSENFNIEVRVRRGDGALQWVRTSGRIERGEAGMPLRLVGLLSDISELRKSQDAVKASELRLRRILDNVLAIVGTLTPEGCLTEANAMALSMGGIPRAELVGKPLWESPWWHNAPEAQDKLRDAVARAAEGAVVRYDAEIQRDNGEIMILDFQLAPIVDRGGGIKEIVASGFDITERKNTEERIRDLLREVNHRSKNLLGVVQAIVRQTAARGDPATFQARLSERIAGLAASQDLLVRGEWKGVAMADLVQAQLSHFGDLIGTRILISGDRVFLSSMAAQGIGMALNELSTNAAKYGALSNDTGEVSVTWQVTNVDTSTLDIRWHESGGPPVSAQARNGFGQMVIGQMAESAVRGKAELRFLPEGVVWTLRAPIRHAVELAET